MIEKIQSWLKAHEQDLLQDNIRMLRIPSLESEAEPNAPFGKGNRQALDLALELCDKAGFKTTDMEGYIGFGDFGQGDRLIMSLGHLDVVPIGSGWKHEPFGAEIEDGFIYARGSCDDKGPTMASFYAMRAIKECCPNIPSRMRQVFGCNEESGFACVYHYMKTEEVPTFGVAPDSAWPAIHGEKGIANLEVTVPLNRGEFRLLDINGGERPNIVIDRCTAKATVTEAARAGIEAKLADSWDKNLTFNWDGDVLNIDAKGKASHGSHPFGGDSAAIRVMRFLREIAPFSEESFFGELFETSHIGGAGLGIAGSDPESRDLTCNLGTIRVDQGHVNLLYNIRYPVTWTGAKLERMCRQYLKTLASGFQLKVVRDSPPLYFPLDHPLIKTITDVYEAETGERRVPGTMGGGTYARAVPNTVSIGTGWPGDGFAHESDERMAIQTLFKLSRIYAHILYKLALLG